MVYCFFDNEEVGRKNAFWRSRGGQYERHFDLGRRNFEAVSVPFLVVLDAAIKYKGNEEVENRTRERKGYLL